MSIISTNGMYLGKAEQSYRQLKKAGFRDFLLDYNGCKSMAVMDGDEAVELEASDFLKRLSSDGLESTIAKTMIFTQQEQKTYPAATLERLFWQSLEAAKKSPCESIIVEPYLFDKKSTLDKEATRKFYLKVGEACKDSNKNILIKNQYDMYNGSVYRSFLSDANQLKEFIADLNKSTGRKLFKIALDIEVADSCGQTYPELAKLLSEDLALLIIDKEIENYSQMALGLRNAFTGSIMVDFEKDYYSLPHPIRRDFCTYKYKVAHYLYAEIALEQIIRKYESRVLFGAGNMCRIYMERYGTDYRPLFTCDNNPATWGQSTCGIEIKNPQELKYLDPKTAIFICNMYYDEIEDQLAEMKLPNPIERFNDENLPPLSN